MGVQTMDLGALRRHHMSLVLELLLRQGPASRASLAATTGLAKATVSSVVTDLLELDLVRELDIRASGRPGRPATDVAINTDSVAGLGLEINVDAVAASIVDLAGRERATFRRHGDNRSRASAEVFADLRVVATQALRVAADEHIRVPGATLALPGLVDPATGHVFVAPNLHWLDVSGDVRAALRLPGRLELRCDNEANLAALAELHFGVGVSLTSFVYVSAGADVGVGSGIVVDGRLRSGAHGFAGEVGHITVDPHGAACGCGARGCLETLVRADAPEDALVAALATALRSVVHVVDPEAVVLGGHLGARGPAFAAAVEERLAAVTLGGRWRRCRIVTATFGADAALVGGATAALTDVLADPTLLAAAG